MAKKATQWAELQVELQVPENPDIQLSRTIWTFWEYRDCNTATNILKGSKRHHIAQSQDIAKPFKAQVYTIMGMLGALALALNSACSYHAFPPGRLFRNRGRHLLGAYFWGALDDRRSPDVVSFSACIAACAEEEA